MIFQLIKKIGELYLLFRVIWLTFRAIWLRFWAIWLRARWLSGDSKGYLTGSSHKQTISNLSVFSCRCRILPKYLSHWFLVASRGLSFCFERHDLKFRTTCHRCRATWLWRLDRLPVRENHSSQAYLKLTSRKSRLGLGLKKASLWRCESAIFSLLQWK